MYLYSLVINSKFRISIKNLIKLSGISLFANFLSVFKAILTIAMIVFFTNKFKGLIIFISPVLFMIMMSWTFSPWIKYVKENINNINVA